MEWISTYEKSIMLATMVAAAVVLYFFAKAFNSFLMEKQISKYNTYKKEYHYLLKNGLWTEEDLDSEIVVLEQDGKMIPFYIILLSLTSLYIKCLIAECSSLGDNAAQMCGLTFAILLLPIGMKVTVENALKVRALEKVKKNIDTGKKCFIVHVEQK